MIPFTVLAMPNFQRMARELRKHHGDFDANFERALEILTSDPHNVSRTHPIKKLTDVKAGEGQFRIRMARWRFRYDIAGHEVVLKYCSLRREDTYR